jgi:hypothetical protein
VLYDAGGLRWIVSGGGPLLLLDRYWLGAWHGHNPDSTDNGTETDYERACAIEDFLGVISVGPGQGVVLGDEPMATAWWPLPAVQGGVLVRWRWAPEGTSIVALLERLPADAWAAHEVTLSLSSGQALLFDSAEGAETLAASLKIDLTPGVFLVETADFAPEPQVALLLHRLVPVR